LIIYSECVPLDSICTLDVILVKKQRRIEFNSGMVGKKVEGARQTAAGFPPVLPRGVMWGR